MEEILNYENREQMYKFLIDDFGLEKIEEKYDTECFGNFFIILSANDFLLSYVNDRSFLDIDIASKMEPENGLPLSFVRDLIYNPKTINSQEEIDNKTRIEKLNLFLKNDFLKISELFNPDNYFETKNKIRELLNARAQ